MSVEIRQPVAWLDEFGNVFPLGAWVRSEVREKWRPLYTAQSQAEPVAEVHPAPAAVPPDLTHKPTVQRLMDLACQFRYAPGDLYDVAYRALQSACEEALAAQGDGND